MQSVSSRIWTRVAVSISYDDNHYTTGTSNHYATVLNKFYKFHIFDISILSPTINIDMYDK